MVRGLFILFTLLGLWSLTTPAQAQSPDDIQATTEHACSFGMGKNEPSQTCHVPVPQGCRVAMLPGSTKPWTTISKGGKTLCRFDEKRSDWKTTITGTCGRCQSDHCSAKFSVRYDCSPQS